MDQLTTQFSILEKTIFEKPLDAKKTIDSQFAKIQRGKLMPANYEQIKFNTIDDISLVSKTFCFNIDIQNIHYECMFNHNNKSKYLYVIYNGWKGSNPLPQFNRWSYQFFFDGSYLGIEDPMYYKYKDIPLGWYYGDTDTSYIEKSLSIVKKMAMSQQTVDK